MQQLVFLPDNAPFTESQRAWLNGFVAGLLGMERAQATPGATPPAAEPQVDEDFPWHDPTLALEERIKLASGRPFERQLMAAMGQLDCGQCGYLCKTYAESIAIGAEADLGKCVPGRRGHLRARGARPRMRPARTERRALRAARARSEGRGRSLQALQACRGRFPGRRARGARRARRAARISVGAPEHSRIRRGAR